MVSVPELAAGQVVDERYEIRTMLGRGALSIAYLASDRQREGAPVVLKFIPSVFQHDRGVLANLKQAASEASQLRHPNLATLFDLESRSHPYIVSEYVEAPSLLDLLCRAADSKTPVESDGRTPRPLGGRGPKGVPLPELAPYLDGIAAALDHVHSCGLVHKDVRPSNLFATQADLAGGVAPGRVGDVCLSRDLHQLLEGGPRRPRTSPITYCAPELIRGEKLDGRADVYALAATVHHLVGGRPLFTGSDLAAQALARDPQPIGFADPVFNDILRAALAKDPALRPATCTEFVKALSKVELSSSGRLRAVARPPGDPETIETVRPAIVMDPESARIASATTLLPIDPAELAPRPAEPAATPRETKPPDSPPIVAVDVTSSPAAEAVQQPPVPVSVAPGVPADRPTLGPEVAEPVPVVAVEPPPPAPEPPLPAATAEARTGETPAVTPGPVPELHVVNPAQSQGPARDELEELLRGEAARVEAGTGGQGSRYVFALLAAVLIVMGLLLAIPRDPTRPFIAGSTGSPAPSATAASPVPPASASPSVQVALATPVPPPSPEQPPPVSAPAAAPTAMPAPSAEPASPESTVAPTPAATPQPESPPAPEPTPSPSAGEASPSPGSTPAAPEASEAAPASPVPTPADAGDTRQQVRALMLKGDRLLTASRDYPGALKAYLEAIDLDDQDAVLWRRVGICRASLNEVPQAVTALRTAVKLKPNDPTMLNTLARLLVRSKKLPEAVRLAQKAVKLRPGDADLWDTLGEARAKSGDRKGATEAYRRAVKLKPGHPHATKALGQLSSGARPRPKPTPTPRPAQSGDPDDR